MPTTQRPTRRLIAEGLGAFAVLGAGVAGIPAALALTVGWPLPRQVPTGAEITRALRTPIPDSFWPHLFATLGWLAWAYFALCVAAALTAQVRGRHRHRLGRLGTQSAVAALVAAVVILGQLRITPSARPIAPVPAVGLALDSAPAAAPPTTASLTSITAVMHTVVEGDTLWGIAVTYSGDGERWPAIYQASADTLQPGGGALSDPHWIYPGWTLVIPDVSEPAPISAAPIPTPSSTTSAPPRTRPTTKPVTSPGSSVHRHLSAPTLKKRIATQARSAAPHRGDAPQTPIRLPSGSVIAGSFAAAVLSALAVGRLRRRHAYRYPPPEPGRDFTSEPLGPTLRQLAQAVSNNHHPDEGYDTALDSVPFPVLPFDDPERRQHPGRIDIGTRNGEIITAEITALSGIAVTGPASDDIARAVIAGLRVRAGPSAAEVLLTSDLAERLLPDLASEPAIRRAENAGDMARAIEVEMIARTRRLAAAEASDAASYRVAVPEDPLPVVVAVLADLPEDSVGRWSALLADAHRLDIAVLFLAANRAATGRLITDASRAVTEVTPDSLAEQLFGAQLFGLRAPEAVDLLCAVADSYAGEEPEIDDSEDGEPLTVQRASDYVDEPHSPAPSPAQAEQWPQQSRPSAVADRPIVVQVLGPYRITAHGEAVSTGLRTRAKALLAWYLIRPEGATSDEAVDALWPDTPPERVQRQFWYGLGDLRARLRGPDGEALDILIKSGERYQSSTGEVVCDLWDFQHALADAARADNDDDTRAALRRAVDIYRGDLLQGCEYLWVEPVRQDLHRRALDAHLRLAEHEKHVGNTEAAVEVLEKAIDLDRYAEEPYRRLMTLHAAHNRPDAVTAAWRLLHHRLGDLDLDVEAATVRLYRSLTATDGGSVDGLRPIRVLSRGSNSRWSPR